MGTKIYYRIKKRRSIWKNFPKRLVQHRNFKWVALAVVLGLGSVFNGQKVSSAHAVEITHGTYVPEPSTISLFCAGAVFLLFLRTGKKNDPDSK